MATETWERVHEVPHVRIGQQADLVVVAPATADLLAKAAHGMADDLLTNTLLTARCPVVFAPAMHTEMWEHPATQENVATLRRRGAIVIEPAVGLPPVSTPARAYCPTRARSSRSAAGCSSAARWSGTWRAGDVVVSAGGTREPLDPVRFLGNRSSGKQGYALAATAAPAAPGSPWSPPTPSCPPRPGSTSSGPAPRGSCARRCCGPPRTPTRW